MQSVVLYNGVFVVHFGIFSLNPQLYNYSVVNHVPKLYHITAESVYRIHNQKDLVSCDRRRNCPEMWL